MTSSPAQYLQSHNPLHRVVLTGGPPLHGSMSLGFSDHHATLLAQTPRSWSRTRRKIASTQFTTHSTRCGAVSYGMVCHSCGFWLVTKPDAFLCSSLFVREIRSSIWSNSAPLYSDLVCANFLTDWKMDRSTGRTQKEGSNSEKTTKVPALLARMSVRVISATLETKRVHG